MNAKETVDSLCKGVTLSKREALRELEAVIVIKENEVFMEEWAASAKRELVALYMAKESLEKELEKEEMFRSTDYAKHIDTLKGILGEATEDENSVCYVTDVDAPALQSAINALEAVGDVQRKLQNHKLNGVERE